MMDKKEFLDILGRYLAGEIDNSVIEESIKFYDGYISNQLDKSEEEVLEEIGDPRLIAKTIIETERASYGQSSGGWGNSEENNNRSNYEANTGSSNYQRTSNNKVYHLKWYHMLLMILILLLVFSVVIRIGWIIIRFFFAFFIPIIIISLLWSMFRRR